MAARSGAGTGVIVSLVVFVIVSIGLLVLSIALYANLTKALQAESDMRNTLETYVAMSEQSGDRMQRLESEASGARKSVARYLLDSRAELATAAVGDPNATASSVRAQLESMGATDSSSLLGALQKAQGAERRALNEVQTLQTRLGERNNEIASLDDQMAQMKTEHADEIAEAMATIALYRNEHEQFQQDLANTLLQIEGSKDRLTDDYEDRIDDLEAELDDTTNTNVVLADKIKELERLRNEARIRATSPDMLVDARVIDVAGEDQVFLDRGRDHRIVLGMTFEVYDTASAIRPNALGDLPRGKASIQVIKVGQTTSTAKIIRAIPGRPIVRDDVLANAVYDPQYRFKFLVHGKFDVDNDGRPTEVEADIIRSRIVEWGGTVVTGDSLPGDLDFLVLGQRPPQPAPLPPGATSQAEIDAFLEKQRLYDTYQRLFDQAREAQIPVLNANRFFILTGQVAR